MNLVERPEILMSLAACAVGLVWQTAKYCLRDKTHPDVKTVHNLAHEIISMPKLTIADADAYEFVATHKKYVNEHAAKTGNLAAMAAALRSRAASSQEKKDQSTDGVQSVDLVRMGKDLIAKKAGQCDHMACAVIAKIVEHIQNGGQWNSDVELVGNGGHAFVMMHRKGNLKDSSTWGKGVVIIDTWLGKLGVNQKYANDLSAGENGVLSKPADVLKHANFFGDSRFKLTHRFTSEELHEMAHSIS